MVQIIKWLSESTCDILIFVVQFLLVASRVRESLPTESVDKQRMLLEALVQGVLLRDNVDVFVVADNVKRVEFVVELLVAT